MLLSRGVVLAWAHVRGGGELGPAWHAAACHGNKQVRADAGRRVNGAAWLCVYVRGGAFRLRR